MRIVHYGHNSPRRAPGPHEAVLRPNAVLDQLPEPSIPSSAVQPGQLRRLADHDVSSLARRLAACSDRNLARAERTALKCFKAAFGAGAKDGAATPDGSDPWHWSDSHLQGAGIGLWARPSLLALSPEISLQIAERAPSVDGTEKLLLRAPDGALIESVILPAHRGRKRSRTTLCVSTQVGCARACTFCSTGQLGLTRQLSSAEIVDQVRVASGVLAASNKLAGSDDLRAPLGNIVFMGMGEPFDNFDAMVRAVRLLTTPQAFGFAPAKVTVSTVGCADKFGRFFAETQAQLAVSLHAPDDARRSQLMPVNRRFNLACLRRALLDALPSGRLVLFQYTLFDGFNDALRDADALADYVQGIPCRINLLPANPGPDPSLVTSSDEQVDRFANRLRSRGVVALIRRPRGRDVSGACGQLAALSKRPPAPTTATGS